MLTIVIVALWLLCSYFAARSILVEFREVDGLIIAWIICSFVTGPLALLIGLLMGGNFREVFFLPEKKHKHRELPGQAERATLVFFGVKK